jgi:hypothetical protein
MVGVMAEKTSARGPLFRRRRPGGLDRLVEAHVDPILVRGVREEARSGDRERGSISLGRMLGGRESSDSAAAWAAALSGLTAPSTAVMSAARPQ